MGLGLNDRDPAFAVEIPNPAKPSITRLLIGAIVGFVVAVSIATALSVLVSQILEIPRDRLAEVTGAFVVGTLSFVGVAVSGLIGLQVIRRDRFEQTDLERRSLAGALAGECRDIAGVMKIRATRIKYNIKKASGSEIEIDFSTLPYISTVIYEGNTNRIGLLGPKLANKSVVLYGRAFVWKNYKILSRRRKSWNSTIRRHKKIHRMFDRLSKELSVIANSIDKK